MGHPKRSITRAIRTRRPRHPGHEAEELEAVTWPESFRVEDRMTRAVVTVGWEASVESAWNLMRAGKLRHLPVLDGAGRLIGIVTDRDLRYAILDPALQEHLGEERQAALQRLRVRDIMTWGVLTVRPETGIREAARLMHERKIGSLPVVRNDKVVGILTEADVVKAFVDVLGEGILSRRYRWALTAP
jgi:acetoin utilization protein AcuB